MLKKSSKEKILYILKNYFFLILNSLLLILTATQLHAEEPAKCSLNYENELTCSLNKVNIRSNSIIFEIEQDIIRTKEKVERTRETIKRLEKLKENINNFLDIEDYRKILKDTISFEKN